MFQFSVQRSGWETLMIVLKGAQECIDIKASTQYCKGKWNSQDKKEGYHWIYHTSVPCLHPTRLNVRAEMMAVPRRCIELKQSANSGIQGKFPGFLENASNCPCQR